MPKQPVKNSKQLMREALDDYQKWSNRGVYLLAREKRGDLHHLLQSAAGNLFAFVQKLKEDE